nr:DUF6094 domain-containing protein [Salibacterium aidingense]
MARMASEQKLGFYPTPEKEMQWILKRVTAEADTPVNVLDPCAGEGRAMELIQQHLQQKGADVTSYGVEIEESRARQADISIDHLLHCSYEEMVSTERGFSLLYLNPPFQDNDQERMEKTFLRDLTMDRMGANGLFIFNLPQPVLKDCADLLARRFDNIRVYRFTDDNYDQYQQVIVYGTRQKGGIITKDKQMRQEMIKTRLETTAEKGKHAVKPLDTDDTHEVQYIVEEPSAPLLTFRSNKVTVQDIQATMTGEEGQEIEERLARAMPDLEYQDENVQLTPAMPLKTAHIATAIASGVLPEQMGADHLLVGVTKRVKEEKQQINDKTGKEEKVVTTRPKSLIRIFSDRGIFNLK